MSSLLILHGALGSSSQFDAIKSELTKRYNIHTLNFSGHGGSELPSEFSIERFADDVLRYLDKHQIESIDIFGYSMGGYVALYLARHYPKRVGRIFTLATKFKWTPEIASKETAMLNPEKIEEKVPAFAKDLERRHQPSDWKQLMRITSEMMIQMGNLNPLKENDFEKITHTVRIAVGDKDQMVTLEETIDTYRKLQNASLIVLPQTQHPVEKVDIKRLASELMGFFG